MYHRYFIQLSYDGSNYHGWQYQPNAITVQQVLNEKLSVLLRDKIDVVGAGRTDTGVHATKYFAHLDTQHESMHSDAELLFKLNRMLPYDIAVHRIIAVPANAHARFAATSRTYHYHIVRSKDAFAYNRAWELFWPVDVGLMNDAAKALMRHQDFTSFSRTGSDNKTNICIITEAYWREEGNRLIFTISANRFLRNMVRAIVGTLVDVGRGKLSVEEVDEIIRLKNRSEASMSAPAQGLYLADIVYPENIGVN